MKYNVNIKKLSEVADLTVGFVGPMAKHYVDEGVPFLRSTNIRRFKIDMSDIKYISSEFNEKIKKSQLREGDVVIVRTGMPGACTVILKEQEGWNCSDLVIIHPHKEKVLPLYIAAYVNYSTGIINANLVGAVQQHFNVGSAKNMEIAVPSIEIQKKIVGIIQNINEKLDINSRINKNLEQQAQALFKSWFVEFEPFNGTMPSDWEIVPLEKIADFQNGYAFKSKELLNEPSPDCYKVFKQGHIARGGGFIPDGTKSWYPKSIASKLEKFVLKKGDILMAMTDMKDNVAILGNTAVMPLDNEYIVNQRVGHLRANGYKGVTYPFIYLLTNSTDFLVDLRSRANSGVQVNLSSSEIKASQTVLPSEEVNNAFSEITLPMFEIIINNQLENQRLAQLRDTLLPKLMSGELDVSDIDL